jgi:hypothetical protein
MSHRSPLDEEGVAWYTALASPDSTAPWSRLSTPAWWRARGGRYRSGWVIIDGWGVQRYSVIGSLHTKHNGGGY